MRYAKICATTFIIYSERKSTENMLLF